MQSRRISMKMKMKASYEVKGKVREGATLYEGWEGLNKPLRGKTNSGWWKS